MAEVAKQRRESPNPEFELNETLVGDQYEFDASDLPPVQLYIKKLTIFLLFLYHYDVMAIYKGTHASASRQRYKSYLIDELRIEPDHRDRLAHKWRLIYYCLYVMFVIRFATVCVVQVILYQANIHVRVGMDSQENGTFQTTTYDYSDTLTISFLRHSGLLDCFSSALSYHPGMSLMIYMSLLLSVSYTMTYIPYKYTNEPINSFFMRFFLDPNRERRRIYLVLGEKIKETLSNIERSRRPLCTLDLLYLGSHKFGPEPVISKQSYPLAISQHKHMSTFEPPVLATSLEVAPLQNLDPLLCPTRYSREYYLQVWSQSLIVSPLVASVLIVIDLFLQYHVIRVMKKVRCQTRYLLESSSLVELLTWPDWMSLFETNVTLIIVGTLVTLLCINMVMHSLSQLMLIYEIRYYYLDLLNALRLINYPITGTRPPIIATSRSELGRKTIRASEFDRQLMMNPKMLFLNDALLKTLVKARVSMEDFDTVATYMSEQVASILTLYGSFLISTLIADRIDGNNFEGMRPTIQYFWTGSGLLLTMCAYVYSKMIQLEPIVWSIIAQLKTLENLTVRNEDLECLVRSWVDFSTKQSASDPRYSVRPFGISLTYRMVLRMNFFVITLAALLRE